MVVEARGFEPLKIPKNHLTYRKAHLASLRLCFGTLQIVDREGFEPPKTPKSRLIYHKPHLASLRLCFGICQVAAVVGFEPAISRRCHLALLPVFSFSAMMLKVISLHSARV